jgi:hypothetical protein
MAKSRRQSNEELETRLNDLETAGRFAKHELASNVSGASSDIASLRFNNLVIGRTYRLSMSMDATCTNNADAQLNAVHNGQTILEVRWVLGAAGTEDVNPIYGASTTFVATANTLTFDTLFNAVINAIGTFAVLEELPFVTQTSAFD